VKLEAKVFEFLTAPKIREVDEERACLHDGA
jgi:hypothetical protein